MLHNVEQIEISHVKLTQILSESRRKNIITIDVPTTRRIKQKQKQLGLGIVHRLRKKKNVATTKGTQTLHRRSFVHVVGQSLRCVIHIIIAVQLVINTETIYTDSYYCCCCYCYYHSESPNPAVRTFYARNALNKRKMCAVRNWRVLMIWSIWWSKKKKQKKSVPNAIFSTAAS